MCGAVSACVCVCGEMCAVSVLGELCAERRGGGRGSGRRGRGRRKMWEQEEDGGGKEREISRERKKREVWVIRVSLTLV